MFLILVLLVWNILNKKGVVMKTFIEFLVFALFVGALYYFWNIPYSSEVAKQYTVGYKDGGK